MIVPAINLLKSRKLPPLLNDQRLSQAYLITRKQVEEIDELMDLENRKRKKRVKSNPLEVPLSNQKYKSSNPQLPAQPHP